MWLADPRHQPFISETMRLVGGALGASRLVFYGVDREQNLRDFVCEGVPPECHRRYVREMYAFDPLHVRRIGEHGPSVAHLADATCYAVPDHVRRYTNFLRSFSAVDTLEMIFRDGCTILAGLNVTWTERDPSPAGRSRALAEQLQRYVEFSLNGRLASRRTAWVETTRCYGLTARECDVAQLLCHGHTNQAIATYLGIELSTVKTHLLRIYEKCGVDSRAGLVGRLCDLTS